MNYSYTQISQYPDLAAPGGHNSLLREKHAARCKSEQGIHRTVLGSLIPCSDLLQEGVT
jgi:hypothetical protein